MAQVQAKTLHDILRGILRPENEMQEDEAFVFDLEQDEFSQEQEETTFAFEYQEASSHGW